MHFISKQNAAKATGAVKPFDPIDCFFPIPFFHLLHFGFSDLLEIQQIFV